MCHVYIILNIHIYCTNISLYVYVCVCVCVCVCVYIYIYVDIPQRANSPKWRVKLTRTDVAGEAYKNGSGSMLWVGTNGALVLLSEDLMMSFEGEKKSFQNKSYLDLPGMRFFFCSFAKRQTFLPNFSRIAFCLQNRLSGNHETKTAPTKLLN